MGIGAEVSGHKTGDLRPVSGWFWVQGIRIQDPSGYAGGGREGTAEVCRELKSQGPKLVRVRCTEDYLLHGWWLLSSAGGVEGTEGQLIITAWGDFRKRMGMTVWRTGRQQVIGAGHCRRIDAMHLGT